MPTVTLRFTLPEEQPEFDAARLGSDAKACIWDLDQYCRTTLKHGEPRAARLRLQGKRRTPVG